MKKYEDYKGFTLVHLREAAKEKCDFFVTNDKQILDEKKRLEEIFDIRIVTFEEMNNIENGKRN